MSDILEKELMILEDESGIEKEEEPDKIETKIEKPFDPIKVQFDTRTITIDGLIKRIKYEEINLFPDFQRKPDLWNIKKQSQLIESILMRIPLPAFFFDGRIDGKWQVIDGLQRLTTFKNFIIDKYLELEQLEYLVEFNSFYFDDLPRDLQRRIEETQVYAYVMREDTPDQVKFNVFKRINTGGLVLEPQEIRHALNNGIPAEFVKKLADSDEFSIATRFSVNTLRMKDRDLVTRFISFYLTSYKDYKPEPDLDSFLNVGMAKIKLLSNKELDELEKAFKYAMELSFSIFGNNSFRKMLMKDAPRNPINKALFETISVNLSKFPKDKAVILILNKEKIMDEYIELIKDNDFNKSISFGTADKNRIDIRFSGIEQLFNKYL